MALVWASVGFAALAIWLPGVAGQGDDFSTLPRRRHCVFLRLCGLKLRPLMLF